MNDGNWLWLGQYPTYEIEARISQIIADSARHDCGKLFVPITRLVTLRNMIPDRTKGCSLALGLPTYLVLLLLSRSVGFQPHTMRYRDQHAFKDKYSVCVAYPTIYYLWNSGTRQFSRTRSLYRSNRLAMAVPASSDTSVSILC